MKRLMGLAVAAVLPILAANTAEAQDTTGTISFSVEEGGIGIGAEKGNGTLTYQGEEYPLTIEGISVGVEFGLTRADLEGSVSGLQTVEDIEGIYTQGEAVAVAGGGVSGIVLQNGKGVELELSGRGEGLEGSIDLGGMQISLAQ